MKLSKILFSGLLSTAFLFASSTWAESVNINMADAKTIAKSLNGIGIKRANEIVKYRNDFGNFKAVEDLLKVKGIGEKILKKNHQDIMLKETKSSKAK